MAVRSNRRRAIVYITDRLQAELRMRLDVFGHLVEQWAFADEQNPLRSHYPQHYRAIDDAPGK